MMIQLRKNLHFFFLVLLFVATVFIWAIVLRSDSRGLLKLVMLDIGQGDAIYIETPSGNQMLIDGGPPRNLLRVLPQVLPFYDRSIDLIMITNPDQDHLGGFVDLLDSYEVDRAVLPGTQSQTSVFAELEKQIAEKDIEKHIALRGMKIFLDDSVYFEVLFPDRNVSGLTTNNGSIIGRLVYGKTSVMFTGDAPQAIERYLVSLDGEGLKSDVLKVGHHGSRTSTLTEFVGFVSPELAIISNGKNNSYGHPHKETIDTLEKFEVEILRTDQIGTIFLESDGETIKWNK